MACRAKRAVVQSQCWLYSKFKARLIYSCSQNDNKKINKSYILYTKLFLKIINRICNVKSYFWAKNHHSFFVKKQNKKTPKYIHITLCVYVSIQYQELILVIKLPFHVWSYSMTWCSHWLYSVCVLIPVHLGVFIWIYMHVHVCAGVPACVHV